MIRTGLSISVAVVFLVGGITPGLVADEIKQIDGKTIECRVVDETYEEVVYKIPRISTNQKIKAEKVKEVVYADKPKDFLEAEAAMDGRDYETARSFFMAVANKSSSRRPWIKQYGLFYAAECLRLMNNFDDAIKAYKKLLTEVPKTRFYPNALLMQAECHLANGNKSEAKKLAEKLAADAASKGFGDRWLYESQYFDTRMNESSNPGSALKEYMELYEKTKDGYTEVANKARLRIGYVYIAQKKTSEAKKYFQEIISNRTASPPNIVAGAYNGLGTTLISGEASLADQKEALYHFLRVVYRYSDVRAEQPRALFNAGKIFKQFGDTTSNSRAKLLLKRCESEFPGTQWANRASKE